MSKSARGIQSIEVSGRIMQALLDAGEPMMLKDMAQAADLKPAQCHAYIASLKKIGLVHQDSSSGLYSPGSFGLQMAVSWITTDQYTTATITKLHKIADDLGVMALVTVWGNFGPTVVHIHAGPTVAALNLKLGTLYSTTGTATGRIFAAYREGADTQRQIQADLAADNQRHAMGEHVDTDDFDQLIKFIRASGFSTANERPIPGLNAISVPIFSSDGSLELAATLIGAASKLDVSENSLHIKQMVSMGQELSSSHPNAEKVA
jgi:DNA-binding IclR family transcriptional regulator